MGKGSFMVASAKLKLNTDNLTESELIGAHDMGANDMMPIMLWIHNFLSEQGEGIVVDLLLDNKGPSAWDKIDKTPSWKRKDKVCQRGLIDITIGKKCSVKPNGVQVVTGDGNVYQCDGTITHV